MESDSQTTLFRDEAVFVVAKRMRSRPPFFRDISFQSPNFDLNTLIENLRALSLVNQNATQLLNLLLDEEPQRRLNSDMKITTHPAPKLCDLETVLNRHIRSRLALRDLNFDLSFLAMRDLHPAMSVLCNDDHAQLPIALSTESLGRGDWAWFMAVAILLNSIQIIRYCVEESLVNLSLMMLIAWGRHVMKTQPHAWHSSFLKFCQTSF